MPPYFYYAITMMGGIALFLYGLAQTTGAFRSVFGTRAREIMSRFTRKKPRAMLFGTILAAVTQGSAVSTSIALGLVDVGMLTLTGSVVVMMGSNIGGTFVTLLISLDVVRLSPFFMAVSYTMMRLGRDWVEKVGKVFHAISLLLVGMFLLKLGADSLLANPVVRGAITEIVAAPFTMFFAALAGAAILQSSASIMALTVAIAASGALLECAIFPVTLGAYLGSTAAVLLAASGGRYNARVLGIATLLYKLAGVIAFAPLIPWANAFLDGFALPISARIVLSQALLTLFNAAIFYHWPHILVQGSAFVLSRQRTPDLGTPTYLDDELLEIPPLAVKLLSKEMIRLTNYIEAYLQMQLYAEKNGGELKELLPAAITDLTEACEGYMNAIRLPSDAKDHLALLEYKAVRYAMHSLREVSRITTGPFCDLVKESMIKPVEGEIDAAEWDSLRSLFMKVLRDAFHAFSLGDGELAQRAIDREAALEKSITVLRSRFLKKKSGDDSGFLNFVTVEGRLARAALDMVRGDITL